MKLKLSHTCVLVILVVVFFNSCKKYPEGPKFSLLRPEKRIYGTWELEKYVVNDFDSTNYLPPCNAIYSPEGVNNNYCYRFIRGKNNIKGSDGNGAYIFENDKEELVISYSVYNAPLNYPNIIGPTGTVYNWEIRKLTNKELWIRRNVSGLVKEVHLKKIYKK
jgi:hypothetical protein